MPYLIDKSALSRIAHPSVQARLAPIIESGQAATCAIMELEVLYSTGNHEEHARARARRALAYRQVPLTEVIFQRAIAVQGLLARRAQHRVPIPDLIIAAAAEAARMTILHYAADFDTIAAVTGQKAEWVAPRGSL
ncbi:PIN domain-containing protein [Candidatus Palauibacter sp.]|uniref:PIN domain-containing protein n=1 Tax=Candidatus Palauibacter sp. TaxID=3101350 RepID=UPI003AF21741